MACSKSPKNTCSSTLMGLVGPDWQKSGLNGKNTSKSLDISAFAPPPPKAFSTFFDPHHCKGKVLIDIFCVESLFPTCLVWALWTFEWKQMVIFAYVKNVFCTKTTTQWRRRWAWPIVKVALLPCGSADVFNDSLAQSVRELWSFVALTATIVAYAGLKEF